MKYDKIIIGAGIYGLYSALYCAKKNEKILIIEKENDIFSGATYNNQARLHMGYHYPRSKKTAISTKKYFNKFLKEYNFCIKKDFKQIYAISSKNSLTNSNEFQNFCKDINIKCEITDNIYFKNNKCQNIYTTTEYTIDATLLKDYYISELKKYPNITLKLNCNIINIKKENDYYAINTEQNIYTTKFLFNSTYASVNQILNLLDYKPFKIKYELCEIILCEVNEKLKNTGITIMDGPFFSVMPFGKTNYHSLTSVSFTPHETCYNTLPKFKCQKNSNNSCSKYKLGNCNTCIAKPASSWKLMKKLYNEYMLNDYKIKYVDSLFTIKPILLSSEKDDSRPTVIKTITINPTFISVLSGKLNTIYDLNKYLDKK